MNQPVIDPALLHPPVDNKLTLFDSHTHVAATAFATDLEQTLQRASDFGVMNMLIIGAGAQWGGNDLAQSLVQKHPHYVFAAGLHPHDAALWNKASGEVLQSYFNHANPAVAVGETGLDYHYNFAPPLKQQEAFVAQLAIAAQLELPFIVHTRNAHDDTVKILSDHQTQIKKSGGIIHCFSEGPKEAEAYLALGMHLSFSGVITFAKADKVRNALKRTPLDRLLIETDAPYLAPLPHRGKRNEPALLYFTAVRAASELQIPATTLAAQTMRNACKLLQLPL